MDFSLLIGTLLGAMVGAYIAGRWIEKGRIIAVTAALGKVVEQETAKAFAQEQGKQAAMIANLAHLDKQMRTLATTQDEIKAKISNELWDRQAQWKEKRDTYAGVIRVTSGLLETLLNLKRDHVGTEGQIRLYTEEENRLYEERLKLLGELIHYEALIQIFGNARAVAAIETFRDAPPESESHECFKLRQAIIEIARADLGLPVLGS